MDLFISFIIIIIILFRCLISSSIWHIFGLHLFLWHWDSSRGGFFFLTHSVPTSQTLENSSYARKGGKGGCHRVYWIP